MGAQRKRRAAGRNLPARASFGCFFQGSPGETPIREDTRPFSRLFLPARPPFGSKLQQDQSSGKESRRGEEKTARILPRPRSDGPGKKRQEKAYQAAGAVFRATLPLR